MIQGGLFQGSEENPSPAGFAKIAILALPIEGTFDYRVPGKLDSQVRPGVRVWISFGGRKMMGVCLDRSGQAQVQDPLDLIGVVDETPLLSANLLQLIQWMAAYYYSPVGEAFSAALPRPARKGMGQRKVLEARLKLPVPEALLLAEELLTAKSKQARVLRLLAESKGTMAVSDLCSRANVSRSPIQTLERHGHLALQWTEVNEPPFPEAAEEFPRPAALTAEQEEALKLILASLGETELTHFLLYGVTGSGKTEIYLRAIEEVIARGRSAIVLVPEISLTPQTVARFRGRFERVAVLHSRLTDKERLNQWKRIQQGKADVVVGARSAIFAPLVKLGLVVIDEEHENTFKQQNLPHYHARTVALKRAEIEGARVILGSATPSLEALHMAQTGRLKPLMLRYRVGGKPLPAISTVNMQTERLAKGAFLSKALKQGLSETLARKKQAILFLNRRGFHTVFLCTACGEAIKCEECDISLTLHRKANRLICHYCGFETLPPRSCPSCKSPKMRYVGAGTERVEYEIRNLFPQAVAIRMDSDTMIGRHAHEDALNRFKSGEAQILIGTQMIAKGLDFPDVTLVGVISADTPLHQPDFRSSERSFQLLSQVSGRAGRGADSGRVIIQSYNPEHYSITHAVKNDYRAFTNRELNTRREAGYPPYSHLMRAVFSGEDAGSVKDAAFKAGEGLAQLRLSDHAKILGPARAPITMINGRYRWHILAKSPYRTDFDAIHARLTQSFQQVKRGQEKANRMTLDVDPLSML